MVKRGAGYMSQHSGRLALQTTRPVSKVRVGKRRANKRGKRA